jgi:hypothetical protein
MEERLSVLKSTFGEIIDLKEGNITGLKTLDTRIQQIKALYSDFIQTNKDQLFVFSLDAFHFQSKLVDLEYEDMNRMFLSITNRMYCDYYKLFKIIVAYVNENIPDKKLTELIKVHDNFPVYKDLEPFRQYDFQYIQSLHEIILVVLTYIHTFITNKEHDLKVYQTKNQIGLHIDSFVSTFSFNTVMMNQRALLFINYVEFFHKTHTKYLKRFTMKLNLMLSQLNNDIKLDNPTDKKTAKKDMMNDLKEHNLDKKLLKELRVSIADDASISGSGGPRSKSNSGSSDDHDPNPNPDPFDTNHTETVSDLSDDANISKKQPAKFTSSSVEEIFNIITINPFDNILTNPISSPFVEPPIVEPQIVEPPIVEPVIKEEPKNEFVEYPDDTVNLLNIHENIIA